VDLTAFTAKANDVAAFYAAQPERQDVASRSAKGKLKTLQPLPRHKSGELFLRGPIPLRWLQLASTCGQRAEAVALLLWYLAGLQGGSPVKLTRATLELLKVHPRTGRRVLVRMVALGLVRAEFHRGRSPVVTILGVPAASETER
jgi:hypothetical protein